MRIPLLPAAYAVALTASISTAYAGPCWQSIDRLHAQIDAKLAAVATVEPRSSASATMGTSAQPASRSRTTVEERSGELSPDTIAAVEQGMARASAADHAGNKTACEQALADVRSALWNGRIDREPDSVPADPIQGLQPRADGLDAIDALNREVDRKLSICRGC